MYQFVASISVWMIPLMIIGIPLYALYKRTPVYENFIDGAKEGFPIAINIIPHLVGMMVAIAIFRETGAMEFYLQLLAPLAKSVGIPEEIIPIGIIRPLTSSGALALLESTIRTHGVDSFLAKIAATIQGSSETTFYVLTVYFGAINVRKTLYALKVGLWADLASFIGAVVIWHLLG